MENEFGNQIIQPQPENPAADVPQQSVTPPWETQQPAQPVNPVPSVEDFDIDLLDVPEGSQGWGAAVEQPATEPLTENTAPYQNIPRFESEPTAAGVWNNSYVQQSGPKPKKVKKHNHGNGKKVAIRILSVVLIVCLSIAGGYVGANLENWIRGAKGNDGVNSDGKGSGSADVLIGKREDTTINIHEVDTSKQMTPAEVYAVNVNATVGITTSITTNYWGYPTTSAASGSGFIYSPDGYIITNYHVIEDSDSITVSLYDGRTLDAKIVGYDESNDVAVLKVEAENLTPVIVGDSANLNVGDPVVAIGNPLGELTFSLTSGAVSALEREVTFSDGLVMSLIQTDCAINSGNSGGALFNLYGEVIGITNAKYSGSSGSGATIDNIGFAIPINRARAIVDSIIEVGFVVKPYIGVTIADVSEETQSYGLPEGASVRSIEKDSPAEKAGLVVNDIITEVNGEKITGASDLKMKVTESTPGDVLNLKLWRQGQIIELELVVGEQIQSGTESESDSGSNRQQIFQFN